MEYTALDVANGDCFAVGQPRTAEQVFAVRNLGIDPELVRSWVLSMKQKKEEKVIAKEEEKDIKEPEMVEVSLDDLKAKYLDKFWSKVPNIKSKDIEWIISKINE